jgi:hypothetical protein
MNANDVMHMLVAKLVEKRASNMCAPATIVLHELLDFKGVIKHGFWVSKKVILEHVWLDIDNVILDPGMEIVRKYGLDNEKYYLTENVPDNFEKPTKTFISEIVDDYQKDRNLFWYKHKEGMQPIQKIMKKIKKLNEYKNKRNLKEI